MSRGWKFTDPEFYEYFWGLIDKNGPVPSHRPDLGNCWVWHNGRRGVVGVANKHYLAHRVAWLLTYGKWPEHCALHHCDNPPCVRPDHLFDGTQAENMADMIAKGRERHRCHRGEQHARVKLSEVDVRAIRESAESGRYWADKLGVTEANISRIRLGKTWRHLLEES